MNTKRNGELGFATAWERSKDLSGYRRARLLLKEIQYAWERAWYGYDSLDVGDLGFSLTKRMRVLLCEFKRHNDTLFRDPETGREYTVEETNRVLDEMITAFDGCEEAVVYYRMKREKEQRGDLSEIDWEEVKEITDRNRREAMRFLSKWCFQLWY